MEFKDENSQDIMLYDCDIERKDGEHGQPGVWIVKHNGVEVYRDWYSNSANCIGNILWCFYECSIKVSR